jgi:hypothetical protein
MAYTNRPRYIAHIYNAALPQGTDRRVNVSMLTQPVHVEKYEIEFPVLVPQGSEHIQRGAKALIHIL